jgi:penicillin-binding protein 1A
MQFKPPVKPKRRKSILLRLMGFAFTAGVFLFLAAAGGAAYFLWQISRDLPDYDKLATYKPPVITRVHANDGRLIAEFARERRIYVPVQNMPKLLINAFLAAEDRYFYEHNGLDFRGIARALYNNALKRKKEGASTITQQVAKNFLLTSEQSLIRKAKEAILAIRIERAYTKDRILDLYLNQIFLGAQSYGVAAAGLRYFGKELNDLEVHEVAYLAALPKAPGNYQLTTAKTRFDPRTKKSYYQLALERRNDIIDNMVRFGFLPSSDGETAKGKPLEMAARVIGPSTFAAEYFAEDVRRDLISLYGQDEEDPNSILNGGYSVRSTLDPQIQLLARTALRAGLVNFDRRRGWRGPVTKIEVDGVADWGAKLADVNALNDLDPWRLGVVLQVSKDKAVVGLQPQRYNTGAIEAERKTVELFNEGAKWAFASVAAKVKAKGSVTVQDLLSVGDVIYVSPPTELDPPVRETKPAKGEAKQPASPPWQLMQVPQIGGATVVMDPHTGRILALVGGFSFAESQFDRAAQARRQPGSSFKPLVYAAAIDNGYTPASIINDKIDAVEQAPGQEVWNPENYDKQGHGPETMRVGIEKSRNLMTVRLAQDLGMPIISEYARRFGVYDDLVIYPAMALGAGETTLVRMTAAYSSFVNGGKKVVPTFIDRIQDRLGATVWRHDKRTCQGCEAAVFRPQEEPQLPDDKEQIISPATAYQVVSMLEGVVIRGTGTKVASVGKPLAGKTGTTNGEKDAWFVGFSPDLAMGVFIGYDNPTPMGHGSTGGELAAPIFRDFFKLALAGKPAVPFRVPPDLRQVRINKRTGQRADPSDPEAITEYFKPGTEPSGDGYSGSGYQADSQGGTWGGSTASSGGGSWGATASRPTFDTGGGYTGGAARQPGVGGLY